MRIASAGSCFAQHISRALKARGFDYLICEPAPPGLTPEQAELYQYGVFSARYGNVYTTLQLRQLVERALGRFTPADQYWADTDGRWFDLLRPRITPRGYASRVEAEYDTRNHLLAVKRTLEEADVLVFTLGLTETWISIADGTAYPTCPGCGSAGDYDSSRYAFQNLGVQETCDNLFQTIDDIAAVNPRLQIILTVSPVPLAATMESRHVLQATTYSKSVLRVAAEEAIRRYPQVHYFGSYEIVTGTHRTHDYFSPDRRSVTDEGVSNVMDRFFRHFAPEGEENAPVPQAGTPEPHASQMAKPILCDEDAFFAALAARGSER